MENPYFRNAFNPLTDEPDGRFHLPYRVMW